MKGKGIYTGAVALIAVAIIAAVSYGMVSTAQAAEDKSHASTVLETKWQWQNAYSLTGKIVSDAVSDSVYNSDCSFTADNVSSTIGDGKTTGYLWQSLLDTDSNCTASNVSVNTPGGNQATATFTLECAHNFEGYEISYAKDNIFFTKQAFTFVYVDPITFDTECRVDVLDLGTGACEVDTIDTATTLIGCGS